MPVYVDALFDGRIYYKPGDTQTRRVGARNNDLWCHMTSESPDELHEMARKIGMQRSWFQGDHYDLTPGMRAKALRAGALHTDAQGIVRISRILKEAIRRAAASSLAPATRREVE